MLYKANNGTVKVGGTEMDYIILSIVNSKR